MHIGVDATFLPRDHRGMGMVVRNFIQGFESLNLPDSKLTFLTFKPHLLEDIKKEYGYLGQVCTFEQAPQDLDVCWYPWDRLDFPLPCPMVMTVHDVYSWKSDLGRRKYRDWTTVIKKVKYVAAISDFVKNEFLEAFAQTPEQVEELTSKIIVCHNSVNADYLKKAGLKGTASCASPTPSAPTGQATGSHKANSGADSPTLSSNSANSATSLATQENAEDFKANNQQPASQATSLEGNETKPDLTPITDGRQQYLNRITGGQPFIFFVGNPEEERKNLLILAQALSSLKDEFPHKILIAGEQPQYKIGLWQRLFPNVRTRYLKKLRPVLDKIPNRVIYTGNLTQEQMIEPYSYCDLFAAVSTYEGFFFFFFEAMACRAPVLCAKVGVLPEVGADVPFYYKPDDVQDLQDKLRFLLKSREIYRGSEQEKKGLQRAELFSSSNAAKAYLKVFEKCLADSPGDLNPNSGAE